MTGIMKKQKQSITKQSQRMEELQQLWKTWRQEEIANSPAQTAIIKVCIWFGNGWLF